MRNNKTIFILIFFAISLLNHGTEPQTRKFLTTGNWYPQTPSELTRMIDSFMSAAPPIPKEITGKIRGIIAPHAGLIYSGQCAANAYNQLLNKKPGPHIERVILLGVSHRSNFYGAAVCNFGFYSTPLGSIPVDTTICNALAREKFFKVDDSIHQYEHSIENQLPFLQKTIRPNNFKIVPILLGSLDRKDLPTLAQCIKKYVNANTLVVASTDLTHYGESFGYTPFRTNISAEIKKLDMGIIHPIIEFNRDEYFKYKKKTGITMCGFIPVGLLMEIFSDGKHQAFLTDYYKSGDKGNDYSLSVSYASMIISEKKGGDKTMEELNQPEQETLLKIARETLISYLTKGETLSETEIEKKHTITANLRMVTGVFVTLRKKGELRGCIGTIIGRDPLFRGVRDNAVNAAVNDYRFDRVTAKELDTIDLEISVMTPLQPLSDYKKIRLGIDGVIIRKGGHQAVFLPQVATETGWNLDQFLGHLCLKAGLNERSYLPSKENPMEFQIFQAQVFAEKE